MGNYPPDVVWDVDEDETDSEATTSDNTTEVDQDPEGEIAKLAAFVESEKARADALEAQWNEQWAEAQQKLRLRDDPHWVVPETPIEAIDRALGLLAPLSTADIQDLYVRMKAANEELAAKHRPEDAPPTAPPDSFDANSLDGPAFASLMRAVASGGVNPKDVPAGYTSQSWSKFVGARLGQ